jgi:CDGSH-type Zn-finger protein
MSDNPKIAIIKNGPYLVTGNVPLEKEIAVTEVIYPVRWEKGEKYPLKAQYSLCRCGKSSKMPYCDGSHVKLSFDGTETAQNIPFEQRAEKITGPGIDLTDVAELCSGARFCDVGGGTWELTEKSDNPASKQKAIQQTFDCPSGRLVAIDKNTGKPIEPLLEKSISVTEDQVTGISGPLWVKGGVPIESSDGTAYEIRNRVTLCRCGRSANKPFCDGMHMQKEEQGG